MIIPIFLNSSPPCPCNCHDCKYCDCGFPGIVPVLMLLVLIWLVYTVGWWLMEVGIGEKDVSLLDMFRWQWDAVKRLRLW